MMSIMPQPITRKLIQAFKSLYRFTLLARDLVREVVTLIAEDFGKIRSYIYGISDFVQQCKLDLHGIRECLHMKST